MLRPVVMVLDVVHRAAHGWGEHYPVDGGHGPTITAEEFALDIKSILQELGEWPSGPPGPPEVHRDRRMSRLDMGTTEERKTSDQRRVDPTSP